MNKLIITELTRIAGINWYESTRCIHSPEVEEAINTWLVMVRNIFEPFHFKDTTHWTLEQIKQTALESDAAAVEFLAMNEYDINRAWFHLSCKLSMGKDQVTTKRYAELIAKQPVAAIFQEVKDKLLRSGAQNTMLGAYTDPERDGSTAVEASTGTGSGKDTPTKKAAVRAESVNYFNFSFPAEYAKEKRTGELTNGTSSSKSSKDSSGKAGRGQKDKNEIKKRWLFIFKETCTLLQRKIENPTEKGSIRKASRGSTTAAEAVLDEAASLGPFYDSPGDDFAEHLRVILGDLTKQLIASREWSSQLRDLFQPLNCYHGPRHRRPKTTLAKLREHLKACDSLTLLPPEEVNLKSTIEEIAKMNVDTKKLFSHIDIGTEGDDEGDIKDLPKILESIENNSMVASPTQSIDWIPTMEDVSDILKTAQLMPINIPVVTFLSKLWETSKQLIYETNVFIDRSHACRTRTKARSVENIDKGSIVEARLLMQRVLDCPLDIGLLPAVENIIEIGEQWQAEVHAIANQGSDRSKSQRQREKEREGGDKSGNASIKRVESLISEGERSVFNFEKELDVLKERRAQAKQWLDKLKNSFRSKKNTSRSKAPEAAAVDADGNPIKMKLADMRDMVEEGAELLADESRGSATSREMGKAQSVVDIAEEWLSRVREALTNGGTNQDLSELQELIGESDDMPVYMEEAVVLRSHFNSMEWAKKARKILYTHAPGYMLGSAEADARAAERAARAERRERGEAASTNAPAPDQDDEELLLQRETEEKEERKALEEMREFAYPKLADVQKIYAQIMKIRDAVPKHISKEFSLKPLIEEADVIDMVESAEAWLLAAKKITVSGNVKKGTKLKKARELYDEAMNFKLNFSTEIKPIRSAIIQTENWIHDHRDILARLNIPFNLTRTAVLEEGDERYVAESAESTPRDDADMEVVSESVVDTNASGEQAQEGGDDDEQVTYNLLQRCVIAGEPLLLDCSEFDLTSQRLANVDIWVLRMKDMCSKNGEEILVEKRIKGGEANGEASTERSKKGKKGDGKVRRYDMVELLEEADTLRINLNKEKEIVRKNINTSDAFDRKVQEELQNGLNSRTTEICSSLITMSKSKAEFGKIAVAFEGMDTTGADFEPFLHEVGEEDDFEEHDTNLVQILNKHVADNRAAAEKKLEETKKNMENDELYVALEALSDSFDEMQGEAEQIGVRTTTTLTIDMCMSALEWVDDVRSMLCPMEETKTPRGAAPIKSSIPRKDYEWGNTKPEMIMALIQDALIVISPESRESFANMFLGGPLEDAGKMMSLDLAEELLHTKRQEFSTNEVNAFQKLVNLMMPASQRRGRQIKTEAAPAADGAEENGEDGDGDQEKEIVEGAPKPRLSRKRKSKEVKTESTAEPPAPKTKRGRKGEKDAAAKAAADEAAAKIAADGEENEKEVVPEIEEEVPEEEEFKTKFAQYKKDLVFAEKEGAPKDLIPAPMMQIIEFYLRCLGVLLYRVCEVDQWRRSASAVMSRALSGTSSSGSKRCTEDVLYLLRYASRYGYTLKERTTLENEVIRVETWIARATAMKKREQMLPLDELKTFVREGERMLFDHTLVREMKEEHRRAKAWVVKLHSTGIEKGLAKTSDLQDLLPEVEEICADLGYYTESIYATTKCYCLCRQAYFGLMVGCDACDDWYHAPCIGLSKSQAERTDAFICMRCTIVQSFKMAAANVGTIANKWMVKDDVGLKRDNDRFRIGKKIQREEREIDRLNNSVQAHVNNIKGQQAAAARAAAAVGTQQTLAGTLNAPMSLGGLVAAPPAAGPAPVVIAPPAAEIAAPTLEATLAAADAYQIKRYDSLRLELLEAKKRLADAKKEDETNEMQTKAELTRSDDMVAWMQSVQQIIWPADDSDLQLGLPKANDADWEENIPAAEYVDGVSKALSKILREPLLPKRVCELATIAMDQKLESMDDVLAVVEGFRWMSWCSVCVQALRNPPTSVVIRRLIDIARTISAGDDRIVRFLQNVAMRSQVWKTKARKMLYYNTPSNPYLTNKRIDTTRANNMLLEGNQIPITSRIKDTLRAKLKNVARAGAEADAPPQEGAEGEADDGKRSRVATKKQEPTGLAVPQPTHVTFTGDLPDSSDEEAVRPGTSAHGALLYAQLCRDHKEGDPPVPEPTPVILYNPASSHTLSEMPKLWPVELSCGAKELVPWVEQDRLKRKAEEEKAAAAAATAAAAAAGTAKSAASSSTSSNSANSAGSKNGAGSSTIDGAPANKKARH